MSAGTQENLEKELKLLLAHAEPEAWQPDEGGRRTLPVTAASGSSTPVRRSQSDGIERRRSERFDLDVNLVRAEILGDGDCPSGRGRVRDISVGGGIYVETPAPLPFRSDVRVDFKLIDGQPLTFAGRLVRKPDAAGMGIQLFIDDTTRGFLLEFIEEARRPDAKIIHPVVVRLQQSETDGDEIVLTRAWNHVIENFADDAAHQAFIKTCLAQRRVEYALDQYRAYKRRNADDTSVDRYLQQVGTIIAFYALHKNEPSKTARYRLPGPIKLVLFAVLGLAMLLLVLAGMR